jgi:cupin superfamily acireductone dioxygenase involved in methionine salvage
MPLHNDIDTDIYNHLTNLYPDDKVTEFLHKLFMDSPYINFDSLLDNMKYNILLYIDCHILGNEKYQRFVGPGQFAMFYCFPNIKLPDSGQCELLKEIFHKIPIQKNTLMTNESGIKDDNKKSDKVVDKKENNKIIKKKKQLESDISECESDSNNDYIKNVTNKCGYKKAPTVLLKDKDDKVKNMEIKMLTEKHEKDLELKNMEMKMLIEKYEKDLELKNMEIKLLTEKYIELKNIVIKIL